MQKLRPALVAKAQILNDGELGKVARNIARKLLPPRRALLARNKLCKHLQNLVVFVRKRVLALAVNAQRAARGHGAAHEGLDVGLFTAAVIAKVALPLIKIGNKQRLPVADNPAYKALARKHRCVGGNFFAQAEGRRKVVGLAFFIGQKKNHRIGVKNAANDAQNMLFNRIGGHGHMGLMVRPPTSVAALG